MTPSVHGYIDAGKTAKRLYSLSAAAGTLFTDLPVVERALRIKKMGLAVDLWSTNGLNEARLTDTGATFTSMTGYVGGSFLDKDTAGLAVSSARELAAKAVRLGVQRLNVHPAELIDGVAARPLYRATGSMWMTAAKSLEQLGSIGEQFGVEFVLENLNSVVDHPGIPLARLKDTLALVSAVDHPNVRLMLDLYHVQLSSGNLIEQLEEAYDWVSEIQVADVPGRMEPGTGEVNWRTVANYLKGRRYDKVVGLEGFASNTPESAIGAFIELFD